MTISSEVRKAGPFSGNGSATSFPFDFKIFSSSDLAVYLTDPSGAESVLGGSDYTAHMNADQESAPGGTVVKTTPLAAGYALTITSKLPYLQPVRLTNQGGFYPEVINTALDRLTVFAQQLDEQVGRAVKIKISDTVTPEQLLDGIKADTAAAKGAAAAAAGSASAASASESAAAGHVQTAQAAASNAQQQAQAAHGSAEVARQAIETIVNVGGITPEQADAKYAPLLNPLFAKRDSDLYGGAIRLQAADNQGFGDLAIDYYGANNHVLISAPCKSGGVRHGLYIDMSRAGVDEWPELLPPAGSILITAANSPPAGYLTANGSAVSRTAYAKLFTNIGTRFGAGDGSTTFNLPDLRGEFIRGWDNGRGADPGRALGSWQDSQNRWHGHSGSTNDNGGHSHSVPYTRLKVNNTGTGDVMMVGNINSVATSDAGNHAHNFTTSGEGGNEARPRNVALMMCIKY